MLQALLPSETIQLIHGFIVQTRRCNLGRKNLWPYPFGVLPLHLVSVRYSGDFGNLAKPVPMSAAQRLRKTWWNVKRILRKNFPESLTRFDWWKQTRHAPKQNLDDEIAAAFAVKFCKVRIKKLKFTELWLHVRSVVLSWSIRVIFVHQVRPMCAKNCCKGSQ